MPEAQLRIRPARPEDVAALAAMSQEFEEFLNGLDETPARSVVSPMTEGTFLADGFGDEPWFRCLIAERGQAAVGYLCYHFGYWIDEAARALIVADLFVRDEERRQGVGRALMEAAAEILRRRGGTRVLWTVWNRNPAARAFYESLGARPVWEELLMSWTIDGRCGPIPPS